MTVQKMHQEGEVDHLSRAHAEALDRDDPLKHLRKEFIIPTKADLKSKTLAKSSQNGNEDNDLSIYLCGNSLGLQPRRTPDIVNSHLAAWAKKGVLGHFTPHDDFHLPAFLHTDDRVAEQMAPLVGASHGEIAVMETLTANLHLMMSTFYKPTKEKYKIILEAKAFPSDHYAIESQIIHHGLDPKDAMVVIEPSDPSSSTFSTSHILSVIDKHASSTCLLLLSGIQYYTGQLFDIKTITQHAHAKGMFVGWDLAHAAGNVDVKLHDWEVDFAVWCTYKYINAGPGAIAAMFVHEKHGNVDRQATKEGGEDGKYRPRLSGWWGGDKAIRFAMGSQFIPIPGAAGYQLGNPSALSLTTVSASLEIFAETSMQAIRSKSVALTGYLEQLLLSSKDGSVNPYWIITPSNRDERGAQLSVRLEPGLLMGVMAELETAGVVVDQRKPDVIRVAPAPLYNNYTEVWDFVKIFKAACEKVKSGKAPNGNASVSVEVGKDAKGWSQIE